MTLVLVIIAVGYLALCAVVFAVQRRLVFPAPVERAPHRFQEHRLPGGAFLLASLRETGPVVVHFHGNGEQVGWLEWLGSELASQGVSFVAVEYPGYPGAPGEPSEQALVDTAREALHALTTVHGVSRDRLVLSGQSLGSGVAMAMAAEGWGTRLVLLSPYTRLCDVGQAAFPWLPVTLLMRDRFDSMARAPRVKVPALVIHGRKDEVVPFAQGEALAGALDGASTLWLDGASHNDLWETPGVREAFVRFVNP